MVFTSYITFGSTPVQITASAALNIPANTFAKRIFIEPLRSNSHACYVGNSSVTANGSAGAIQELAIPQSTSPLDRFDLRHGGSVQPFDPSEYYVQGTSGEGVKVSVWEV
jgi:hypothetical protein